MENESKRTIKNPFLKLASYILIAMIVGIGLTWVCLGIVSPVLLFLLIQKW